VPVELGALAREVAARPWPLAVEVECRGDVVATVRAPALACAIENLVTNAVQHAEAGTAVTIAIRPTRITVSNRGPAISRSAQAKLWYRFYTTRAQEGGSGMRLSIVRAVALAHGGSVGVRCAGGVTEMWIELA